MPIACVNAGDRLFCVLEKKDDYMCSDIGRGRRTSVQQSGHRDCVFFLESEEILPVFNAEIASLEPKMSQTNAILQWK